MGQFGATPEYFPPILGKQWHILSLLWYGWNYRIGPCYTDEWLIDYVKRVNQQGGIVSLDAIVSADGTIYEPHLIQLVALGKGLGKGR